MIIKRRSRFTGKFHEMDLPVTQEQLDNWAAGTFIQDAMPHLTPDEREFIMTGVTKEEWDAVFNNDEAEKDN